MKQERWIVVYVDKGTDTSSTLTVYADTREEAMAIVRKQNLPYVYRVVDAYKA